MTIEDLILLLLAKSSKRAMVRALKDFAPPRYQMGTLRKRSRNASGLILRLSATTSRRAGSLSHWPLRWRW